MPQVKITIKEDTYKKLKKAAEKNYRTTTEEINFRLAESFNQPSTQPLPLQPFTPPPDPITNPPYKITLDSTTTPEAHDTTHTTTSTKHKDIPERWMRLQRYRPK